MFEGISAANVIEGLAVAAILAVVTAAATCFLGRLKAARLRRQREENFVRLFEEFRALSYDKRGAAVLAPRTEKQAELQPGSEELQRLKDEGYISRLPDEKDYFELTGKGWSWLKDRNSREAGR